LSEVIFAFVIQYELMIASTGKLHRNDQDDWLCGRADNTKQTSGSSVLLLFISPSSKVATGSIAGAIIVATMNLISATGGERSRQSLMIEEWGVETNPSGDSVAAKAAIFNNAGVAYVRIALTILLGLLC
jgi:hypothetical protein